MSRSAKGGFFPPEFNRKFRDESAAFSFDEDKNRKGQYHICVNDIPLVQWFRQKANEWRIDLGIASTRQDKDRNIESPLKSISKANKSIRR